MKIQTMVNAIVSLRASIALKAQSWGENLYQIFAKYLPVHPHARLQEYLHKLKKLTWGGIKNQVLETAGKIHGWVFGPSEQKAVELNLIASERREKSREWQQLLRQPLDGLSSTLRNPMLDVQPVKQIGLVMKNRDGSKIEETVMVDLSWQVETEGQELVHHQMQVIEQKVTDRLRSVEFISPSGAKVKMIPHRGVKRDSSGESIVRSCYHPISFSTWTQAQKRRFNLERSSPAVYQILFTSDQERLNLMRVELDADLSSQFKEYTTNPRSVQEIIYQLAELLKIPSNVWFNDFQWKE